MSDVFEGVGNEFYYFGLSVFSAFGQNYLTSSLFLKVLGYPFPVGWVHLRRRRRHPQRHILPAVLRFGSGGGGSDSGGRTRRQQQRELIVIQDLQARLFLQELARREGSGRRWCNRVRRLDSAMLFLLYYIIRSSTTVSGAASSF